MPAHPPPPMVAHKPPLPPFPHPEPREYHQMLRTWNYAWWRPAVGIVAVIVGAFVLAPLALLPVLMLGVLTEPGSFSENFDKAANLQSVGPASLLYLNLTLASAILVCWAAMRLLHRMRPRWLSSVVPKIRWKLLFIFMGLAVVALVAQFIVSQLMPSASSPGATDHLNHLTGTTLVLALVVLLTTPLQAAGEEYVFRGYLMQAIGSWSRNRWIALVGTATLFALAHGVQNFPLFFDRFTFGIIAGWLVIRTGGLEVGIAMHILNNFVAFGYALLFSDLTSTLNVSEVGWANIPVTITQAGTYAVLVILVARKMDVQRRTRPPADLVESQRPSPPESVPSEA